LAEWRYTIETVTKERNMRTFLVQKTVYISTQVEATTWEEAMEKSSKVDIANWKQDDEETPTVTVINTQGAKMLNDKQNKLLLEAVDLLNRADALMQQALGASDECYYIHCQIEDASETLLEHIQENNPAEIG